MEELKENKENETSQKNQDYKAYPNIKIIRTYYHIIGPP